MRYLRAIARPGALVIWGLAGSQAVFCSLAAAESAPATNAQSAQAGYALEEVVVTAEKRTASVQDTAISLTALSGAELQAQGLSDVADATRQVPGLAQNSAGPGQTEYTIRGLASPGAAVSTVGFYLDDVPMTAPSGSQNGHVVIDPDLYDLNRVEVLRGPQGTLYGSGSMGGTIKLVTNQPDLHAFSASAKLDGSSTLGGGFNGGGSGMLNIPLIDGKIAMRVVGTRERTSGWIDRDVLGDFPLPTNPQPPCAPFAGCTRGNLAGSPILRNYRDVNTQDLQGARGSIRYDVTDQLKITATAFYQNVSQDGLGYIDSPPGNSPPGGAAHYQPFDIAEPFSDAFRLYNLVGEWTLPDLTVTAATSYWTRSQSQLQDISETIQTLFDLPAYSTEGGGVGSVSLTEIDYTKQFSEELRLTSRGEGPWQWLIGGFYSKFTYKQDQFSFAPGFVPIFGSDNLVDTLIDNSIKQTAQFGELSYKFAGGFKATVGARHYSYTQGGSFTTSGIVTPSFTPTTTYVAASDSGFNPKVTLSYEVDRNWLVYGTAAKGFRPGAGNLPIPTTGADSCVADLQALGRTAAPSQYDPDTVWSYELGEKATLLDRRLTVNAAVYYERWNRVQQAVQLGCGFSYIDNVGAAEIRGGEAEVNFRVTPSLTLSQSGGYTHAILTQTEPGTGLTDGQKLLNVPTYSLSTSIVYTRPIGEYSLVARASNVLVGPQDTQAYFLQSLPSYDIANVRLGVLSDHWSAFAYVNNVADTRAQLSYTHNYALNIPSLNRIAVNQPRTTGIEIEYHY